MEKKHEIALITTEEMQETFYNILFSIMLNNKQISTKNLVTQTIERILLQKQFETVRSTLITLKNVPETYKDLFTAIVQIKQTNPPVKYILLNDLVDKIIERELFTPMLQKTNIFYNDLQENENKVIPITIEAIRETFYNIMVDQFFVNSFATKQELIDREPRIYFAMTSFVIVSQIMNSLNEKGIRLFNKSIVTVDNCPKEYIELFTSLITLKNKVNKLNLSDKQINIIKACVAMDDQKEEIDKSIEIMSIVGKINGMSIKVSQLAGFKLIIDDVIKFCIEALGNN